MISCEFGGRLGNILLEIYTVFWVCYKNKINFSNIKFNKQYNAGGLNEDCSKRYNLEIADYIEFNKPIFDNIYQKHFIDNQLYLKIIATTKKQSLDFALKNKNTTSLYFKQYTYHYPTNKDEVKLFQKLFLNKHLEEMQIEKHKNYFNNENIALHVRRTDYSQFRGGKYIQSKSEILNAIHKLRKIKKNENMLIVCFSDDIEWCKNNIQCNNIVFHAQQKPYEDLYLMSLFDNYIVNSHSSFSYCAQLLNKKLAYIPKRASVTT